MLIGVVASSCGGGEKPAPPADEGSSPPASLRPLTSRDRVAPPAAGSPTSDSTLPPGHPPIDAEPSGAAPPPAMTAAAGGASVAGTITVAPTLQSRAGGAVLFVIARAGADRHIVAVRRENGVTFPFAFRISGADAMTAGTSFSGPLEITARLSKTGDAIATKGDIEGVQKGVAVGAKDVKIVLDTVHE